MAKYAVVFWSGTGNTEQMANAVADGIKEKGGEVDLLAPTEFTAQNASSYAGVAFGCPSMGAEVLEETEMQPMWDSVKSSLNCKVALFGSYGWGDGEWMRNWESEAKSEGVNLTETYICNETPDDDSLAQCKSLGATIV